MKVSIVTPSYNQGQFIARTMQSVASQTGAEIEHVVFDGGSTDDTVDVLKNLAQPVRWVSRKVKGQTDAVNQGIRATTGEIIGWLNSDDVYYVGTIAHVVSLFNENPDVDVVYGAADHIDINDQPFESYPTTQFNFQSLQERCFICQPALFFRRRLIDKFGALDETLNYCMDYEYWLRLGKEGVRFVYTERKLAGSRLYADNKTLGSRVKVHREINDMLKKVLGNVPDRWIMNYAHAVAEEKIVRQTNEKKFRLAVAMYSFSESIRCNKNLSSNLIKQIISWVR